MGDILLIGVWASDETLRHAFGIFILSVSISEKTPLLVFYWCLDVRWNCPSCVWYITSQCLHIRWNTPSRVLSVFRCQMKHSFSCLKYYSDITSQWQIPTQCFYIRENTPSRVLSVFRYQMKLSFLCLIYYLSVFAYQMKHSFSCFIYYFSVFGYQTKKYHFVI